MIDGTEVPVCSARSSWILSVESLWDGEGFFCGGRLGTGPRSMDIPFDQPARVFLGSGRIGGLPGGPGPSRPVVSLGGCGFFIPWWQIIFGWAPIW